MLAGDGGAQAQALQLLGAHGGGPEIDGEVIPALGGDGQGLAVHGGGLSDEKRVLRVFHRPGFCLEVKTARIERDGNDVDKKLVNAGFNLV